MADYTENKTVNGLADHGGSLEPTTKLVVQDPVDPNKLTRATMREAYLAGGVLTDLETSGDIIRMKNSFCNFISNSGFESWSSGVTDEFPDAWFTAGGDVLCSRSATACQGSYSCQATFNSVTPSSESGFANSWGKLNQYVSYTLSCYYQKLSGSGEVAFMAQVGESPWTEIVAC